MIQTGSLHPLPSYDWGYDPVTKQDEVSGPSKHRLDTHIRRSPFCTCCNPPISCLVLSSGNWTGDGECIKNEHKKRFKTEQTQVAGSGISEILLFMVRNHIMIIMKKNSSSKPGNFTLNPLQLPRRKPEMAGFHGRSTRVLAGTQTKLPVMLGESGWLMGDTLDYKRISWDILGYK